MEKFESRDIPLGCKPEETTQDWIILEFHAGAVEFDSQSRDKLTLKLKGSLGRFPDQLHKMVREALGPVYGEAAITRLYDLSVMRALNEARIWTNR